MKKLLNVFAAAIFLFIQSAYAKEVAVLLPITGPLTPFEKNELSKEVVEGFSVKFELQYGDAVDRFVKQAFQEESKKSDCDETNCYRRIAEHYHAETIIVLRVAVIDKDRYLVTSHFYDVPTGTMTNSQKEECVQCSFEKLKAQCRELSRRMIKAN
jgi:hypothetical protein